MEELNQVEQINKMISKEMSSCINEIILELDKNFDDNEILKMNVLSSLKEEYITYILNKLNISPSKKYYDELKTVYSLARYLLLYEDAKKDRKLINELFSYLNNDEFTLVYSDEILPYFTIVDCKNKYNLDLIYSFNEKNIKFYIKSNCNSGFPVNIDLINSIINNTTNIKNIEKNTINNTSEAKLDLGDILITVKRK